MLISRVGLVRSFCHLAAEKIPETPKVKHCYKTVNKWTTKSEFAETLIKNTIFNEDGLVAINKPYGIGKTRPAKDNFNAHRNQMSMWDDYYIEDVLEDMAKALGYTSLSVCKSTERFSSGITLLAADEKTKTRINHIINKMKRQQTLTASYVTLCLGVPHQKKSCGKLAVKLDISENKKRKIPVIVDKWSKSELKSRIVKTVLVDHKVVKSNENVSLVQIVLSRTKSHFLRLYCATKLMSPILGDHICGSRVKNIAGYNLLIDHWSPAASHPQSIPSDVLNHLQLLKRDVNLIPSHIHHDSLSLLDFFGNGKHVHLTASFPEYFVWSCQQFGIFINEKNFKSIESPPEEVQT